MTVYLITGPDDEIDIVEAPDMQKAIDGWRVYWLAQDENFDNDPKRVEEFGEAHIIIIEKREES